MRRSMSKPLPLNAATVGLTEKDAVAKPELLADAMGGFACCLVVTVLLSKDGVLLNLKS